MCVTCAGERSQRRRPSWFTRQLCTKVRSWLLLYRPTVWISDWKLVAMTNLPLLEYCLYTSSITSFGWWTDCRPSKEFRGIVASQEGIVCFSIVQYTQICTPKTHATSVVWAIFVPIGSSIGRQIIKLVLIFIQWELASLLDNTPHASQLSGEQVG